MNQKRSKRVLAGLDGALDEAEFSICEVLFCDEWNESNFRWDLIWIEIDGVESINLNQTFVTQSQASYIDLYQLLKNCSENNDWKKIIEIESRKIIGNDQKSN